MKPLFLHIYLVCSIFCLTSCYTYVRNEPGQSRVDRAMHMMDEGRFDEAIEELKIVHEQIPSERNSQLLASAYAGRAGLRVEDYWDFVVGFKPWRDLDVSEEMPLSKLELQKISEKLSESDRERFLKLQEDFKELARLRKRVDTIPLFAKEKSGDLTEAIRLLESTETRGARLYRAVLGLVLLKSSFEDGAGLSTQWESDGFELCTKTFPALIEWIGTSFANLQEILADIGKAYPHEQSEIVRWQEQLKVRDLNAKSLRELSGTTKKSLCQ
jgi:hypothetical protein